jgi:methionine salvage enolase-phosphatase E1
MSKIRFKSAHCIYWHTEITSKNVLQQRHYAADIKKTKLQTVEIHIWDSGFLGDKLRDKFEDGIRDAVIWPELTLLFVSLTLLVPPDFGGASEKCQG